MSLEAQEGRREERGRKEGEGRREEGRRKEGGREEGGRRERGGREEAQEGRREEGGREEGGRREEGGSSTLLHSHSPLLHLSGLMSTAMILPAPASLHPIMTASPTAPQPNTATLEPGSTLAVFRAAP